MPTVHFNALVALTLIGLAGMTGSAAAQFSSQFDLDGDVATPGVYNYASLSAPALPATTEKVTYMAGSSTVMDTFTGTGLWTLLQSAGGVKPIPGVKKNSSLLNYVVAVGSDGYQAVFSGGEINPMFGGSTKAPDMVAYSDTNSQLGPNSSDGFARMVVPGDTAGGRYVSNLVKLYVGQAPVPKLGPGGLSTQLTLSGVESPGVYDLHRLETTLPAVQLTRPTRPPGRPSRIRTLAFPCGRCSMTLD